MTKTTKQPESYTTLAEQLRDIRSATLNPSDTSLAAKLRGVGMSSTTGSDGGFLIASQPAENLLALVFQRSYLLDRVSQRPVTIGNTFNGFVPDASAATADGGRLGGFEMPTVAEDATIPFEYPKTRAVSLHLNKSAALVAITADMLEDEPSSEAYVTDVAAGTMRALLERRIWRGSGVATALGVCSAGALITQTIEGTQTIANTPQFIGTNAAKMVAQMLDLETAAFWVNPDLLTSLLTATANSNEKTVITPPDAEAPFGRIATRPLFPNYAAPAVGTVGDFVCASMPDYLVVAKGGLRKSFTIHARFLNDESLFRFSIRWNGAPMLSQPYAPDWSTGLKSHYVALAARS
ncbi:phage major capsid protein [Gemmatimonas sp.]|uniref:phage major capsid protein n=1 Tax=Gemmatimonas sp. TaxID=1962908 RepID=UPI003DA49208